MRLRLLGVAFLALTAGSTLWGLQASGNFAAADGFSGRLADCTACHNVPHPTAGPATAHLEGLPETWEPEEAYDLRVRVEGGPPALPPPAPQGGFEIEASGGRFHQGAADAILRQPHPATLTYDAGGAMQRTWEFSWQAPDLSEEPRPAHFWLAVVSASGNHVVLTNTSDAGERFDAVATMHALVPPSPGAVAAWRGLPLEPVQTSGASQIDAGESWVVTILNDANATVVRHRLDEAAWQERPALPEMRLRFAGLAPGVHKLELETRGMNRTSPVTTLSVAVADERGNVPGRDAASRACNIILMERSASGE